MTDKRAQGKKNRRSGAVFELKVRKDLENQGFVVSKWMNNVDLEGKLRLIPAKRKFNPYLHALSIGTGFPDFIAYGYRNETGRPFGVEAKCNGRLDREEREKCAFLIKAKIFAYILIASKGTQRGSITYREFAEKIEDAETATD